MSCLHHNAHAQDSVIVQGSDKGKPDFGHSAWLYRLIVRSTLMWNLIKAGLAFIQFHNMILMMGVLPIIIVG